MYYFQAMKNLVEFKDYILSPDNYLKIYIVDLDEFDFPTPIMKGCFGTNISMMIEEWKTK